MKKIIFIFSVLLFTNLAISQTNSVVLKDGTGTIISQHNTIQSAYDAIPSTVTQSYTIEILSDYNGSLEVFPITFGAKSGTSATNRITLRPALGNSGEVISGNSTSGILVLSDADFIIIDGRPGGVGNAPDLKIENLATTGTNSNTIALTNGATNNIIRFVHAVNNTQNTAGPRTIVLLTSTTVGNSNNIITRCKIEGGRSGVGIAGSTTIPNDSNTISNCEIFNWGYAGVWLVSGAMNTNIDSCKIYQTVGVNNTIVSGIIMSTMSGATYNIRKNWIYDLQSTSTSTSTVIRGIYAASPNAGSIFNVQNNMVSNTLDNLNVQTVTGIEFLGSNAYTANIYYNTIRIGGNHTGGTSGATTSAGIRIGASALTLNMKNNICINYRTGGNVNHIGFALVSTTGTLNIDYNCYYANGTNSFHAYWGTTGYNNLSDYKAAASPNEQNTVFNNVTLVSATNLHLTGASVGDTNLKGTPIAGITTDFDNDLRHPIAPYKGADEVNIPLFHKKNETSSFNYNLYQNYPNPFNPTTAIKFSLAKGGLVTLKVYDVLGREVAELLNNNLNAGEHNIVFNAFDLPSGIYFYRLVAGTFSQTKQMILLK
ncbi:MAG: T9SS type A sorting domain-containing protein [Ignavibacteria bacterium]|nr:T9SS type A sorting domain-containing protein [Ignavibacteria bacterium]